MKRIALLFLGIILASSCSQDEVQDANITPIDINPDLSNRINFIDLVDSLYLIPLETKDDNALGVLNKIELDQHSFYILDYSGGPIQAYTKKGDFRHYIGRLGRGEGEYNELKDFFLTNSGIGLLDFKKVIHYSYSGEYQNSINLDVLSSRVQPIGEDLFMHYISNGVAVDNTSSYLYLSSSDMKAKDFFINKGEYTDKFTMDMNVFAPTEDGLRIRTDMSDIIYTYNLLEENNQLTPTYMLNFGKYFPDDAFFRTTYQLDPISFFEEYRKKYIYFPRYRESGYFFCISYFLNEANDPFFSIYSKKNSVTYDFKVADSDPFTYFFNRIMCNDGEWFISAISAMDLIHAADLLKNKDQNTPRFSNDIVALSERLEISDNPVLVAIRFKDLEN